MYLHVEIRYPGRTQEGTYDQGQRRPEVSESEKPEPMGLTRAVSVGQVNRRIDVRQ